MRLGFQCDNYCAVQHMYIVGLGGLCSKKVLLCYVPIPAHYCDYAPKLKITDYALNMLPRLP